MRRVRVLLIDDSMTMRRLIRLALSNDPRIEVVGEARDAGHAREKIAELRPDVLTLDIEMPGESGLAFLEWQMARRAMPIIMVSSETHAGSAAAVQALSLGAFECVGKPVGAQSANDFTQLCELVVAAAAARITPRSPTPEPVKADTPDPVFSWNGRYVLIGSSTGGVEALDTILADFPANCPPTVITQHMPASFLISFTQRLNARLRPQVTLAAEGMLVQPGHIYFAPGDTHLALASPRAPTCRLIDADKRNGHRPSVDYLFESGAALGEGAVAVMLTGMGGDGARGMLAMRRAGATCLAQDEASSVVWGMPRVAQELGAVDRLVPLQKMATAILGAAGRQLRPLS